MTRPQSAPNASSLARVTTWLPETPKRQEGGKAREETRVQCVAGGSNPGAGVDNVEKLVYSHGNDGELDRRRLANREVI